MSKGFQSIRDALKKMGPRGVYCKDLIRSSKIHKRIDPGKSRAVEGESLHKRLEEGLEDVNMAAIRAVSHNDQDGVRYSNRR